VTSYDYSKQSESNDLRMIRYPLVGVSEVI